MASTATAQHGIQLPPLMPFLALGGVHASHQAVTSSSPFLWPAYTSVPTPSVPRTTHLHQPPTMTSPAGSPGMKDSTVISSLGSSSTQRRAPVQRSLPPLRPWLAPTVGVSSSSLTFVVPAPLLPCWGSRSMPTSPTSSPPQSPTSDERRQRLGMKRKRAMSVPPVTGQRLRQADAVSARGAESEVTFPNGAQVAKWKLNGPRYKRCKVTDADGADQWKTCQHCGTDSTPEWRNGPLGKGTLCNACGLRYRSKQKEKTSRGQSGNVPVSLLLNPTSNKKGRTNINNPMVWETKLSSSPPLEELPQPHHAL